MILARCAHRVTSAFGGERRLANLAETHAARGDRLGIQLEFDQRSAACLARAREGVREILRALDPLRMQAEARP